MSSVDTGSVVFMSRLLRCRRLTQQFSSFYASEGFFGIKGHPEESRGGVRGNPPTSTQVQYYGYIVTIVAPPLASACSSVFVTTMRPDSFRCAPGYTTEYTPGQTFNERMDDGLMVHVYTLVTYRSTT